MRIEVFAIKKTRVFCGVSSQKPRLVAGVMPLQLSTEIICRGAFSPRFFSNFPFQPNTPIAQQIYNTEKEKDCQTFYACFLKNFYMILFPFFPFDKGNFPHYNVAYELFQTQIKTPARLRMGGIRILPLLCRGI